MTELDIANQFATASGFQAVAPAEPEGGSSLDTNTAPAPAAEPAPTADPVNTNPPADPIPDIERIKTEYEAKIKEYETKLSTPKDDFANEAIRKMNELAKAGVDIDSPDFWKWQSIDLDSFSTSRRQEAIELKRLELSVDNPELTAPQVERLIKRQYPVLFDSTMDENDEEYIEAMEDLSIDATRARTKLKEHKEKIQLPKVDLQSREQEKKATQEALQKFNMVVKQEVNTFGEQAFKLADNMEIKYFPNEDSKKFIESAMVNNTSFFSDNYVDKANGTIDFPRLKRDLLIISDFDRISKAIYDQGVSKGKEAIVSGLENNSVNLQQQKQEISKDPFSQALEQISLQQRRR
jgi:hypothetical protein